MRPEKNDTASYEILAVIQRNIARAFSLSVRHGSVSHLASVDVEPVTEFGAESALWSAARYSSSCAWRSGEIAMRRENVAGRRGGLALEMVRAVII
ncbi:MAG TPA: hypothetical protein VML00_09705 [Bacteroidota bacterium]|nr:hypothetical protein [Bacteroidota bacterium]